MKNWKSLLDWKLILAAIVVFNIFPLLALTEMFPDFISFILDLMIVNPIFILIICLLKSEQKNFNFLLPLELVLLFVPTIFIFYNGTAWVYIFIYLIVGYIASLLGTLIKHKIKKTI